MQLSHTKAKYLKFTVFDSQHPDAKCISVREKIINLSVLHNGISVFHKNFLSDN